MGIIANVREGVRRQKERRKSQGGLSFRDWYASPYGLPNTVRGQFKYERYAAVFLRTSRLSEFPWYQRAVLYPVGVFYTRPLRLKAFRRQMRPGHIEKISSGSLRSLFSNYPERFTIGRLQTMLRIIRKPNVSPDARVTLLREIDRNLQRYPNQELCGGEITDRIHKVATENPGMKPAEYVPKLLAALEKRRLARLKSGEGVRGAVVGSIVACLGECARPGLMIPTCRINLQRASAPRR